LALEAVEASLRTYREQTVGAFYEMTSLQLFLLGSLAQLGELKQLAQRTPVALREATERGDLYAAVNYRIGNANLAWVISGDVAGARKHVVDAMAQWSRSGVHLEHFYELYALTNLDLYTGDAAAAFARAADRVPVLRWALITRVQSVRIQTWQVRAKSALALAEKDPTRRRALLAIVSADAGRIEGERAVWSNPIAALLRAGAANVSGDAIRAAALLDQAAAGFDAVEMKLQATAARAALGAVMGGDEGRALRDQANGWFLSETVREPDRMIAMVAPGFGSARIG
jgi:hypothetical protein